MKKYGRIEIGREILDLFANMNWTAYTEEAEHLASCRGNDASIDFFIPGCYVADRTRRRTDYGCGEVWCFHSKLPERLGVDPGGAGGTAPCDGQGYLPLGAGSFPQLKIPHHNSRLLYFQTKRTGGNLYENSEILKCMKHTITEYRPLK